MPNLAPATPTSLFPFNGSAWKATVFQATVTDPDSVNLTFKVDYSNTDSTLATHTTVTQSITLPSAGSSVTASITPSGSFTTGQWFYWRAYVSDDSGNTSAQTSIFSFQYEPSGSFSPATKWMQQASSTSNFEIIDVSQYQGTVNWTQVQGSGINYAYHRVYGADHTTMDTSFVSNVSAAHSAGVKLGGYFFAMPAVPMSLSDADSQAQLFANALQQGFGTGNYGDLLPVLDLEDNSANVASGQSTLNLTVDDLLTWANEFRNHFQSITGRTLGLYVNDYFVRDQRNNFNWDDSLNGAAAGTLGNQIHDMPLWVAGFDYYVRYQGQVMPADGGWTKWYVFQHTDKGTTPGVTGNNDRSWSMPIEWFSPPKTPTGLSCTDNGTNITVTWNTTAEQDVHNWQVWVDGTQVGSTTTDGSYVIISPTAGVQHTIEVRPIDDFGDKPITPATINYTMGTPTTAPSVTVDNISRNKISAQTGENTSTITFHFDKDVSAWTVNVNGADHTTGTVAGSGTGSGTPAETVANLQSMTVSTVATYTVGQLASGSTQPITAGTQIQVTVNNTEMYQEGTNRVNIYGESNADGTWTPYDNV